MEAIFLQRRSRRFLDKEAAVWNVEYAHLLEEERERKHQISGMEECFVRKAVSHLAHLHNCKLSLTRPLDSLRSVDQQLPKYLHQLFSRAVRQPGRIYSELEGFIRTIHFPPRPERRGKACISSLSQGTYTSPLRTWNSMSMNLFLDHLILWTSRN